jgi:hypothetical protein
MGKKNLKNKAKANDTPVNSDDPDVLKVRLYLLNFALELR